MEGKHTDLEDCKPFCRGCSFTSGIERWVEEGQGFLVKDLRRGEGGGLEPIKTTAKVRWFLPMRPPYSLQNLCPTEYTVRRTGQEFPNLDPLL